ncbi:MAG: hypothetical protein L0Y71_04910 [Gemmataceae bacterium]|nr:hypothetical protein [Gemmataceae bacterium]
MTQSKRSSRFNQDTKRIPSQKKSRPQTVRPLTVRPAIEALEDRSVPAIIAADLFHSSTHNLDNYTNSAEAFPSGPNYPSAADSFARMQRAVTGVNTPFGILDDSAGSFPGDQHGIIGTSNTDTFFGVTDTQSQNNPGGPVTASWVFNIAAATQDVRLSIAMGAMGNFDEIGEEADTGIEASTLTDEQKQDFFIWTVSIDGGAPITIFASDVDSDAQGNYTLEGGVLPFTRDDPLQVRVNADGNSGTPTFEQTVTLSNVLQSVLAAIPGTANATNLTVTLTAQTQGDDSIGRNSQSFSEAMAFQNIVLADSTIEFASADTSVTEAAGNATVTLTRGSATGATATAVVVTSNGTADGNDYTAGSYTASFGASDATATVVIPIADNNPGLESTERFNLTIDSATNGIGAGNSSTVTIEENAVRFETEPLQFGENIGNAAVTITRTAGSDGDLTVVFETTPGTALGGSDFVTSTGTVTFTGSQTEQTFSVVVVDDLAIEAVEQFALVLTPQNISGTPGGGALINEIRTSQAGEDTDEFFELRGAPSTSLGTYTYLVIGDGSAGDSGVVEAVISLAGQTIGSSGIFLVGEAGLYGRTPDLIADLNFENDDVVTHILVENAPAGLLGLDVDTNNDGVIDVAIGTIIDSVALVGDEFDVENGALAYRPEFNDHAYSSTHVGPDGPFVPGHVYRDPNNGNAWAVGNFTYGVDDTPGLRNDAGFAAVSIIEDGGLVAFDMLNSAALNVDSYTNAFTEGNTSAANGFEKYQVDVSATIPFAIVDGSGTGGSFANDDHGIIEDAVNKEEFFGIADTEAFSPLTPVTATWVFNVSAAAGQPLTLSLDMGAMGNFESPAGPNADDQDFFTWTYQFDAGPVQTAFASIVDEDSDQVYTLHDGDTFTLDDPILIDVDGDGMVSADDVKLSNKLQTLTRGLLGSGNFLTVTLTARTVGELATPTQSSARLDAFAFQNLVIDEAGPPVISVQNATVPEGVAGGNATITVTRAGDVNAAVTVQAVTVNDSAVAGSDYTGTTTALSFAAGETRKTFTVPVLNPGSPDPEGIEQLFLNLSLVSGPGSTVLNNGVLTIEENVVRFSSSAPDVLESSGTATITITRSAGSDGDVTVVFQTLGDGEVGGGTAIENPTAGFDYTGVSTTVTFTGGSVSQTVPITITTGDAEEPDETVGLSLSGLTGTGATLGTPGNGTFLTIVEDFNSIAFDMVNTRSANLVSFNNPFNGLFQPADTFGKVQVGVTAGNPPFSVLDESTGSFPADTYGVVNAADNQEQFFAVVDTFTFDPVLALYATWVFDVSSLPGGTGLQLQVDAGAIGDFESISFTDLGTTSAAAPLYQAGSGAGDLGDGFFWLYQFDNGPIFTILQSSVNESISHTYTLADGDTFTFDDPISVNGIILEAEGDANSGVGHLKTLTESLQGTGTNLTVTLVAYSQGDAPGESSDEAFAFQNLKIVPTTDAFLNISNPTVTANETTGNVTITVTRSGNLGNSVMATIETLGMGEGGGGTATEGAGGSADFDSVSTLLTFGAGVTERTIVIPITNDSTAEDSETINVLLSGVTAGGQIENAASVVTIQENIFSLQPVNYQIDEGTSPVTVTVVRTPGSDGTVEVQVATNDGTALAGEDYTASTATLTFTAGQTSATATVAIIPDSDFMEADEKFNIALSVVGGGGGGGTPFINEYHYDDSTSPSDINEFIEVAFPAGFDATNWSIVRYNGSGGATYNSPAPAAGQSETFSGTVADETGTGWGFRSVTYLSNGLQNGAPDGFALVNPLGVLVQFLSYEGTFTGSGGPADGQLSAAIPVGETNSTAPNSSVQLQGTGNQYSDFTWAATSGTNTKGAINASQTLTTPPGGSSVGSVGTGNGTVTILEDMGAYAYDMLNSRDANLVSLTINTQTPLTTTTQVSGTDFGSANDDLTRVVFGTPADAFGKYRRGTTSSIPFDVADDSNAGFTGDSQGIIDGDNTNSFFAIVDSDNTDTSDTNFGELTATWVFDLNGLAANNQGLTLAIDAGAMGVFEAGSDFFRIEYSLDGETGVLFSSVVNVGASQQYVLADGDSFTLDSPLTVDTNGDGIGDVTLSNTLQTLTRDIFGGTYDRTATDLTITLTARIDNNGAEAVAFQSLKIFERPNAEFNLSEAAISVDETVGSRMVTVTRSGNLNNAVSVTLQSADNGATAGSDYTTVSTVLNFAVGQTSATVAVAVTDDQDMENTEQLLINLSAPSSGAALGALSSATLDIVENVVVIQSTMLFENEGPATVTITRTPGSDGQLTVPFSTSDGSATTAGNDYTATSGTVTFANNAGTATQGDISETVTVAVTDDSNVAESDETFNIQLTTGAVPGSLRIVDWNIAQVDVSAEVTDIDLILAGINSQVAAGITRNIDIIFLQEVTGTEDADLAGRLSALTGQTYVAVALNAGSAGAGRVDAVYNDDTVDLVAAIELDFNTPRNPVRYQFTVGGNTLYAYNSHYSASSPADQLTEAQGIRTNANALGQGANIIYVGDFNIDSSSESMYVHLLSGGNGQAFDPINAPGDWHNNPAFLAIHTQATTFADPPGPGVGGGMDDRFDFILASGELLDGAGFDYAAGSYRAYGNNGTHDFNGNISSGTGAAANILTALQNVSDHLPVVADFRLAFQTQVTIKEDMDAFAFDQLASTDRNLDTFERDLTPAAATGALGDIADGVSTLPDFQSAGSVFDIIQRGTATASEVGDAGDTAATAQDLIRANSHSVSGSFTSGTDIDAYRFFGQFGARVTITVAGTPAETITLIDPDGNMVAAVAGMPGKFDLRASGEHAVLIDGSAAGGYTVSITGVGDVIPFALADDSVFAFDFDTQGIIAESDLNGFLGVADTVNGANTNPVSATWVFDVPNATDFELWVDMAAMGDFEANDDLPEFYNDFFTWTYSFDAGPTRTAWTTQVDEDGLQAYTLADGFVTSVNDPMELVNQSAQSFRLTNQFQTFSHGLFGTATGGKLTVTLTARTDGDDEAFAFRGIAVVPARTAEIEFGGADVTVNETIDGTITLTRVNNANTTVEVELLNDNPGEATAPATVTLNPGDFTKLVVVDVVDDQVKEASETAAVTIEDVLSGGVVKPAGVVTRGVIIEENVVRLASDRFELLEPDSTTNATFSVTRTPGSDGQVVFEFRTADGDALSGQDFTGGTQTITFANNAGTATQGEVVKDVLVPILDEGNSLEPIEDFKVSLFIPSALTSLTEVVDNNAEIRLLGASSTDTIGNASGIRVFNNATSTLFFNVEGTANAGFEVFAVADFILPATPTADDVANVRVILEEDPAGFAVAGTVEVYLAQVSDANQIDATANPTNNVPAYQAGNNGRLAIDPVFNVVNDGTALGTATFTPTGAGNQTQFNLTLDGSGAGTEKGVFLAALQSGGRVRFIFTPGAAGTAATWAGQANTDGDPPTLLFTSVDNDATELHATVGDVGMADVFIVDDADAVAYDLVGNFEKNKTSGPVVSAPVFSDFGDAFALYNQGIAPVAGPGNAGAIPFALVDESAGAFPADTLGIIKSGDLFDFFGVTDTTNADNVSGAPLSVSWVFDLSSSSAQNFILAVDMAGMGDFETLNDSFTWTVTFQDGPTQTVFVSMVDELASKMYTLESGTVVTEQDPILVDGIQLSNDFQSFQRAIGGKPTPSSNLVTVTLTASLDGSDEALAFRGIKLLETTAPVLNFTGANFNVNEGGGNATVTVTRQGNLTQTDTVTVTTSNGTAGDGTGGSDDDYTATTSIVTFLPNATTATVTVPIMDDATAEGNEFFNVALSAPGGTPDTPLIGTQGTATVTILDDEDAGTLNFSSGSYSVNEGEGLATVTVTRTRSTPAIGPSVFINELHYDNESDDAGEFVEIAGPAGTDLSGWSVVLYNGSGGTMYATINLSGAIDNESSGYGALSFAATGIQNGSPDGLALVDDLGVVQQLISYEGEFIAADGPAAGMQSQDIGVAEEPPPLAGQSLRLIGQGTIYGDFAWASPATESPGSLNAGQTFKLRGTEGQITVVVVTSNGTAGDGTGGSDDDYVATTSTVTFADGDAAPKFVTVAINDDDAFDPGETLSLTLQSPTGGSMLGTTNPTTLTIGDPVLFVQDLVENDSGFEVIFNRAFDRGTLGSPQITLYNGPGQADAVDVTLTRNASENILGSFIFNLDSPNRARFVATGGVLPTGTYTVVMRTTDTGFQARDGRDLDGDANGTAGGEFNAGNNPLATFTFNTPTTVVAIPDFARGANQSVDVPNALATNGIPFAISDTAGPTNVTSVQFDLYYRSELLNILAGDIVETTGIVGAAVSLTAIPAGSLPVGYNAGYTVLWTAPGGTPLSVTSTATTFARLDNVEVPAGAVYSTAQALVTENLEINGAPDGRSDDAVHVGSFFGDADANELLQAQDTLVILERSAGNGTGFAAYRKIDPRMLGDINGDLSVLAQDALDVLNKSAGVSVPNIPDIPGGNPPNPAGPDPLLFIPKGFKVKRGGTVTVPVNLQATDPGGFPLQTFDLGITYDASRFTVSNIRPGSLTGGFLMQSTVDQAQGTILLVGLTTGQPVQMDFGAIGSLVLMDFTAKGSAAVGGSAIDLEQDFFYNGTHMVTGLNGNTAVLLHPPTNGGADVVDGWIKVTKPKKAKAAAAVPRRAVGGAAAQRAAAAARARRLDAVFASYAGYGQEADSAGGPFAKLASQLAELRVGRRR